MIDAYTLEMLCNKYNLSAEKLVNKNNNILKKGEYVEIDKTLDYLINDLKISVNNIEKCPSILYRNVNEIKYNVDFLKTAKINFSSIETCLHVLSSDSKQLVDTYNYVFDNYGVQSINNNTSILSCPINVINDVENLNLKINKDGNLTIAVAIEFGNTNLEEIQKIIHSEEFIRYPKLFTSQTLAYGKLEEIQKIIHSEEFKRYPDLFTSETLAYGKLEEIQKIIHSEEFKRYPKLFTSETLANANLEEIQKIIHSEEFKRYPDLFTSTTIAHGKLEEIQKIIHSEEFKTYPDLFTSQTLARTKLEDIKKIINIPYFKDDKYRKLLTCSIVSKGKKMIEKLPTLFEMAEEYEIDNYITTSFLLFSPSQNYALINYLIDNNKPLVIGERLNSVFGKQPGRLLKEYGIDVKELIKKYPYEKEINLGGVKK